MPSTGRKLELKAKASVAQTGSRPFVFAKGLMFLKWKTCFACSTTTNHCTNLLTETMEI
jgi:hypothetical protein